ncbi:hypothetical protein DFH06DRAFT_1396471, partial [Mycena polygramma]
MLRYQLEVAVALSVSAVSSLLLLFLNRAKEGKIRLADDADGSEEIYPDGDPFDITTAEDLVDGYPIEEEAFWAKMRTRKIILSTMLGLVVLLQAGRLGLGGDLTIWVIHLCFALYVFGVAVLSVFRQTVSRHTESVWHLTSLTLVSASLMGFISILP